MSHRKDSIAVKRIMLSAGLVLILGLSGIAVGEQKTEDRPLLFRGIRIFDGSGVVPRADVIVNRGRIEAVGPDLRTPVGAEIIEGEGKTLLPGLIDAHVHVWSEEGLRQFPVFGVTSVIDMFMDVPTMRDIQGKQRGGAVFDTAFLVSPGILATAPGGHGTQYGLPIPTLSGPGQAEAFVDARIKDGSDFIKIIYDDGSAYNFSRPTLGLDTIQAIVAAAHARGRKVVVHAATLQNCLDVMAAGADGLAHLFFNDAHSPDFGKTAAEEGAFVIPTLSVLRSMSGIGGGASLLKDDRLEPFALPADETGLKQVFPFQTGEGSYRAATSALRQLRDASVPILAGTDAPNPGTAYGISLHQEMLLLVEAGLPPAEALRAATSRPAEFFDLQGRGRIQKGWRADLLLVEGDPTREIRETRNIIAVWKDGRRVDRQAHREKARKAKAAKTGPGSAPPPEYSESGWISDFDGDEIESRFGSGWMVSTDSMMGGKSTAAYRLVKGGAEGSLGALKITGSVSAEGSIRWAGAMFSPGAGMMAPANLSSRRVLEFWARGDEQPFSVMIFAKSLGFSPAMQSFEVNEAWTRYEMTFESFGLDGNDLMGFFFGGSMKVGEFTLLIDQVRLQ